VNSLLPKFSISINPNVFLKDPISSDLGKKIIRGAVDLISEKGFEYFNFRKLALDIESTEASVYRYFENKHYLLTYLVHWYWGWMEYRLMFKLINVDCPEDRLERAVLLLTSNIVEDSNFSQVDEQKLNQIVISESSKVYLNRYVDEANSDGLFKPYKDLVQRVSDIILEINPTYKYPHMLVSTVIEGTHHQRFFATHLPRLTDVIDGEDAVNLFYKKVVFNAIKEK